MAPSIRATVERASVAVAFVAVAAACGGGTQPSIPPSSAASPRLAEVPAKTPAPAPPSSASDPSPAATASPAIPRLPDARIARSIPVPGFGPIALGDGYAWAVDNTDNGFTGNLPNGNVYRIALGGNHKVTRIPHAQGGFPTVGEGALWLINAEWGETATRVDAKSGRVTRFKTSTTDEPVPEAVVTTPGAVWVGNNGDGTVAKIDPSTLKVEQTIVLVPSSIGGVRGWATTDDTSVWFSNTHTREIYRIDAATGRIVSRMQLPLVAHPDRPPGVDLPDDVASGAEGLVVDGDRLYASSASHVYVIDVTEPGSERIVGDIPTEGFWAVRLAKADSRALWGLESNSLLRFDPDSGRIVGRTVLPQGSQQGDPHPSIGLLGNSAWLRYPDEVRELTLP